MHANMNTFFLFTLFIFASLLVLSVNGDEEKFMEINVKAPLKYYDSDGVEVYAPMDNVHHRFIRERRGCKYPINETDYWLNCRIYLDRIYCAQMCTFGTTLSEGILRDMSCSYEEDIWRPTRKFEDCEPFVDCTIELTPGGKYKCYTNYLERGPKCEVSCLQYEDKPAVSQATYECDINGNWTPKLPHCALAGTGLYLVPPPEGKKIHDGLTGNKTIDFDGPVDSGKYNEFPQKTFK